MTTLLKVLKWLTGLVSGILSLLFLLYLGLQKNGVITDTEGNVIVNRTMAVCLIVSWIVSGVIFILSEYLYKRFTKNKSDNSESDGSDDFNSF